VHLPAPLLVLPRDGHGVRDAGQDAQADERDADGVALGVVGRVGRDERVR